MKKTKKVAKHTKAHTKIKHSHNHAGNGVYWYGVHIHHIGLGVAAVGTLLIVIFQQQGLF